MESSSSQSFEEDGFLKDPISPRWARDVLRFIPIRAQFLLSGNVRDRFPFPFAPGKYTPITLSQYLVEILNLRGYDGFLNFNLTEGLSVMVPKAGDIAQARSFFEKLCDVQFDGNGFHRCSLDRAMALLDRVLASPDHLTAIFVDFASRLSVRVDALTEREHEFFTKALMLGLGASPRVTRRVREAHFNLLFWICERDNDLPGWLVVENPRVRSVTIPRPDSLQRGALARALAPSLNGFRDATEAGRTACVDAFVDQTEGLLLADVVAISQLARRERLSFEEIGEAVRRYKLGVTDDPWKKIDRKKIRDGEPFIRRRVKGQRQAVTKALDIVKRAITGLSGAQASKGTGRPRGVLFLAGPTGVGKTELAKTITELLFGDERAYIRFDMSEFSAEHADQRLIGAPPGYVGYDAGGELTNAIREKPFAVVLFDEIEKAHPRILDKFLQLLDDGVLASGRGERVYFSESVIVFTSNLGIYRRDANGNRVPTVTPDDPYEVVEERVRTEIENHFKTQLNRPEILNRIGENIVVFDFIRPDVAREIYSKMVANILGLLAERQRIRVVIPEAVQQELIRLCTSDLSQGGRGIGNKLEAWLINPLARALFDSDTTAGATVRIRSVGEVGGVPTLELELEPERAQEPDQTALSTKGAA